MAAGQQHVWLWLTKRPTRMPEFGEWLSERGVDWPANLVAMTTITDECTAKRAAALGRVPAKIRGLSCEPLGGLVEPHLNGIDWGIAGGGRCRRHSFQNPDRGFQHFAFQLSGTRACKRRLTACSQSWTGKRSGHLI